MISCGVFEVEMVGKEVSDYKDWCFFVWEETNFLENLGLYYWINLIDRFFNIYGI